MSTRVSSPLRRRWWHRLLGSEDNPHGLPDDWVVLAGPAPRTEIAIGPGGVFLLDHRRSRPREVLRLAGDVSGRLTAGTGHCVTAQGVLVEEAERAVRTDQPHGVTIVTSIVLGAWLASHPPVYDDRELRILAAALRPAPAPTA